MMNVLVCGGFGFAGHYLVYKLLKEGNHIILLGRSKGGLTIEERFEQLKADNAKVNPTFKVDNVLFNNVTLITADISKSNLGIAKNVFDQLIENGIAQIFNMAAYLRYEESYRAKVIDVNVKGTQNLLEIAQLTGAKLIHASTAYIADKNHKDFEPIKEEYCYANKFINVYIESKCKAELLIKNYAETNNIAFSIFRFPMLVGDSQTGYTNSKFGVYEYISALIMVKKKAVENEEIRVKAISNGNLNLVPTDCVINGMLEINKSIDSNKTIFNLTDEHPVSAIEIGEIFGKIYNLNFVVDDNFLEKNDLTDAERLFNRLTARNNHFANKGYVFDSQNTNRILGRPITSNWDKSISYFEKVVKGFTALNHRPTMAQAAKSE